MKLPFALSSFVAIAAIGCGSTGSESLSSSDSQLSSEACLSEAAATSRTEVTVSGVAVNYPAETGLANVSVCTAVVGSIGERCIITGRDGKYSFQLPVCHDVRLTYQAVGYANENHLLRVGSTNVPISSRMLTTAQMGNLAQAVGQTYDPTRAHPIITTWTASHAPLSGVKLTLTPASGTPWYLSASGVPTASATATANNGIAGITNVSVGTLEVKAEAPGLTCRPQVTVPGSEPGTATLEAVAGSIAEALFVCE
jgi:hypothetical protein